jgi:threonine aldolase
LGGKTFIEKARRARKILGGGMRQAGVIAAAGLYALENNVARLKDDHTNAQRLADGLRKAGYEVGGPNTNMVMVKVERPQELAEHLKAQGIIVLPRAPMRLVTHLDVDAAGIDRAVGAFGDFLSRSRTPARASEKARAR